MWRNSLFLCVLWFINGCVDVAKMFAHVINRVCRCDITGTQTNQPTKSTSPIHMPSMPCIPVLQFCSMHSWVNYYISSTCPCIKGKGIWLHHSSGTAFTTSHFSHDIYSFTKIISYTIERSLLYNRKRKCGIKAKKEPSRFRVQRRKMNGGITIWKSMRESHGYGLHRRNISEIWEFD